MPNGHQPGLISIQDPLDPTNDVGKSSYGAYMVQKAFENGFMELSRLVRARKDGASNHEGTYLGHILAVSDELINQRLRIASINSANFLGMNGFSEDCHPPTHPAPTPSHEVS
jgi:DNA polymerase sigma